MTDEMVNLRTLLEKNADADLSAWPLPRRANERACDDPGVR